MKQERVVTDGIEFTVFYCDLCEALDKKNKLVLKDVSKKLQAFYTINELEEHRMTNHCCFDIVLGSVNGNKSTNAR